MQELKGSLLVVPIVVALAAFLFGIEVKTSCALDNKTEITRLNASYP